MEALAPLTSLLSSLETRLSAVEAKLGTSGAGAGAGSGAGSASASAAASSSSEELRADVEAFDALRASHLTPFTDVAAKLGGDAAALGDKVAAAFDANRAFLLLASKSKKPALAALRNLAQPTLDVIKATGALKDRGSDYINHQTAVAEGIGAFQWIIISPAPGPIVESCHDGAEFYLNKVRVQYRKKDENQMEFCAKFKALLQGVQAFVKEHHKMGLSWNPKGGDAAAFNANSAGAPAPAPAAAPKPPAPAATSSGEGAHLSDVFAQLRKIDQSGGKTQGLRHVSKDMKSKGASGKVPVKAAPKPAPTAGAGKTAAPAKPQRIELVKKRWFVENVTASEPVYLNDVSTNQEVYIYNCHNATIIVAGKIKAMQIDSCKRSQIVWESTVSAVEVVNCQRIKVQVKGSLPSIALDKTDGAVVYLSHESKGTQIITSKCSELNVSFPSSEAEDADWLEQCIPEQFQSHIIDGKVVTTVSDLYAH